MATEKIPIRAVFDGATATGLAEYQATEVVGVTYGGIGTNTLTSNSILLGNGTNAVQSSSIQIVGTTLSSTDSTIINVNEGLVVEGNLTVTGSITVTIANSSLTNSSFTLADDTSSTTTINLGETLKISGTSNEIETTISGDTITIGLPSNVTIGNNLIVTGDLTVNGTTTTINSTTLTVDDKNIELASVLTPTDVTADGAGITIKGTTDKTFNWLDATDSFTSSEHIDLASGKVFKINNSTVLSSTEVLGKAIPSGTIVGTSDSQTLTNKTFTSPKINEDVAVTATATELNYTDGVTSAIQTQLDAKASRSFAIAQAVALG